MKTRTSIYHRTFAFAYVLLVAVIFCGCGNGTTAQEQPIKQTKDYHGYNLIVIDSCEYLEAGGVPRDWTVLTHKGNCKFCAKRSKK